jgi:hypothetical protein
VVPSKNESPDVLLAIATDLLAQAEAQHRIATRLEDAARELPRGVRYHATPVPPIAVVREQFRVMRDLIEAQRALLDELERELSGAGS